MQLGPLDLLVIQPTPFCNLDCDYCYLPNRQSKARIGQETLRRTFQRVFESDLVSGPFTVVWHAGEPLALPVSLYREASRNHRRVQPARRSGSALDSDERNADQRESWRCSFIRQHSVRIGVSVDGRDFLHDIHIGKRAVAKVRFPARGACGIDLLRHASIHFFMSFRCFDPRRAPVFPTSSSIFYQAHDTSSDLAFNIGVKSKGRTYTRRCNNQTHACSHPLSRALLRPECTLRPGDPPARV